MTRFEKVKDYVIANKLDRMRHADVYMDKAYPNQYLGVRCCVGHKKVGWGYNPRSFYFVKSDKRSLEGLKDFVRAWNLIFKMEY